MLIILILKRCDRNRLCDSILDFYKRSFVTQRYFQRLLNTWSRMKIQHLWLLRSFTERIYRKTSNNFVEPKLWTASWGLTQWSKTSQQSELQQGWWRRLLITFLQDSHIVAGTPCLVAFPPAVHLGILLLQQYTSRANTATISQLI